MRIFMPALALGLAGSVAAIADPLGSDFTYQGQLSDGGAPANGTYDLQFALFTSATGGTAVDTVNVDGENVSAGLINASLDFSDAPYDGQALWVEVSVRATGGSSFTTLSPRQAISATPYALYALNSNPLALPFSGSGTSDTSAFQVQNNGSGPAITAISVGSGIPGAALVAQGAGIGAVITNSSTTDTALLLGNNSSGALGSLLKAFVPAGIFTIDGHGNIISPSTATFAGSAGGLAGTALNVNASAADGIALIANAASTDTTAIFGNANSSGTILKGFGAGGATEFQVDANGEVFAHGAFHPNGVDYSDRLPAARGLEAGDVVAIGDDGLLHRSTHANATDVAGVYSTKPGVVGKRAEEQRATVPVALAGVIPVRATQENGAIHPGDLLVSSSTPGRAMRAPANAQQGTVIGKAMQPLDRASGEIEMLVMLR